MAGVPSELLCIAHQQQLKAQERWHIIELSEGTFFYLFPRGWRLKRKVARNRPVLYLSGERYLELCEVQRAGQRRCPLQGSFGGQFRGLSGTLAVLSAKTTPK